MEEELIHFLNLVLKVKNEELILHKIWCIWVRVEKVCGKW